MVRGVRFAALPQVGFEPKAPSFTQAASDGYVANSVEPRTFVCRVIILDIFQRLLSVHRRDHPLGESRGRLPFRPVIRVPQPGPDKRFRTMHEGFLDLDDECEQRLLAVDRMPFADRVVSNNASFASYTQCVAVTGHDEEQGDVRVFQ